MSDLPTARQRFLDKVSSYEPGQATRFAGPLDELIRWSEANALVYTDSGTKDLIRFSVAGMGVFWSAIPRVADGARFALLSGPRFAGELKATARDELARIDGKDALPDAVPTLAFGKLIWEPYRVRVLDLMSQLLTGLKPTQAKSPAAVGE
jgi:hypothetical protein